MSHIVFPPYPIPVLVKEKGAGYILYIKDSFIFSNDEFAIVLEDGGELIHCTTKQFTIVKNQTYNIKENK